MYPTFPVEWRNLLIIPVFFNKNGLSLFCRKVYYFYVCETKENIFVFIGVIPVDTINS